MINGRSIQISLWIHNHDRCKHVKTQKRMIVCDHERAKREHYIRSKSEDGVTAP